MPTLGEALAQIRATQAVALAWDAFNVPPGTAPRKVFGDFDWTAPYDPNGPQAAQQFRRRYGFSTDGTGADPRGTKGSVDGGERRFDPAILREWLSHEFPAVDVVDLKAMYDAFYVVWPGTAETVYAAKIYPWLLDRKPEAATVRPGDGAGWMEAGVLAEGPDIAGKLDSAEARLANVEGKIDALIVAVAELSRLISRDGGAR